MARIRRNKQVKCRCSACRFSNAEAGFKLVNFKTQKKHHKKDIERQFQMNAPPTLNSLDETQLPQQTFEEEHPPQSPTLLHDDVVQNRRQYFKIKMKNLIIKIQVEWDNKGMAACQ